MKKFWSIFVFLFIFLLVPVFSEKINVEEFSSFKNSTEKYFIVEFDEFIFDEDKDKLSDIDVEFLSFIGENKFLTKFDESLVEEVESFNFVKSISRKKNNEFKFIKLKSNSLQTFNVLSSNVIEKEKFDIEILDLDVIDLFIEEVESLGGEILEKSNKIFRININPELVEYLSEFEEVGFVEEFSFMKILNADSKSYLNVYNHFDNFGLYGEGQVVAVADTGLDIGVVNSSLHSDFLSKSVTIENLVWSGVSDDGASDLSSGHGTHVAGSVLGTGVLSGANLSLNNYSSSYSGTAPKASLYFQALEAYYSGSYSLFTPLDIGSGLFQKVYDLGIRIHSNSWGGGNFGEYSSSSSNVDSFIWNNDDFVVLFAAGNCGAYSLSQCGSHFGVNSTLSPGTSKNVITVGASVSNSSIASFSSRGPTDDGRIKPDVVAPGSNIISTRSSVASGTLWGVFNDNYVYSGGTSMATPLVAGVVALVREYLDKNKSISNPSAALIKAMLINGATDITGTVPDMNQGWGFVNLNGSIYEDDNFILNLVDYSSGLSTSEEYSYNFTIVKSVSPLKISVVWSDYPGSVGAGVKLVNNLDVVLVSPNGTEYFGNDFTSPFNDTKDILNNVEGIRILSPEIGVYSLKVKGYNIPSGPQPFAFVISRDNFKLSSINFTSPIIDEIVYSDNLSFELVLNFSSDIKSISYFNGSSDVNLSSLILNNNSISTVLNVSSFGNQSILFNYTDFNDLSGNYFLNFTLVQNLLYVLSYPVNNSNLNLSKLIFFMNLSSNKNITSFEYVIDGHRFNVSDLINGDEFISDVDILDYGEFNVSFFLEDYDNLERNFTLLLNFSSKLSDNLTDFDNDGVNNSLDYLLGNSSNVNSNFNSLNITVNSSSNFKQLFSNNLEVVIGDSSEKVIEFSNNFSSNLIDLSKVIVKKKVFSDKSKFYVKGLNLESGKTKTIYLKLSGNISKSNSLCLKDEIVYSFSDISSGCDRSNETFISSIPVFVNGYNLTYFNSSNNIVKITGLKHSGVSQMCTESWSYGDWSSCSSSSQSRTAVDLNSCSTTFTRESLVQSCTSESSSGGSSGGGGGGGSSSSSSSSETVVVESSEKKFKFIYPELNYNFEIFVNGVLLKEDKELSNERLIKFKDVSGYEITRFVYNFSEKDFDLNLVDLSYNFSSKSFVRVFGLDSINKIVNLKNNLNSNKVCVSVNDISEDCSLGSEFVLDCDGLEVNGVSCVLRDGSYVTSGTLFVQVSEFVNISINSNNIETEIGEFDVDKFKILDNVSVIENSSLGNESLVSEDFVESGSTKKYFILSILILFGFFLVSRVVTLFHHKNKF
jgi:subtilisin family serine protease